MIFQNLLDFSKFSKCFRVKAEFPRFKLFACHVELREVGIFTAIGIEIRTEAQGSKLGLFIGQVVIVSRTILQGRTYR